MAYGHATRMATLLEVLMRYGHATVRAAPQVAQSVLLGATRGEFNN
ncbi:MULTISPECIES: hypothetical protein [unclassified Moorena]|nr:MULTISPECIES: hypothetical protein [unclassified Moorena]NEP34295.1 hypothetical protein [Moorena sp. SIO3B2]NEQ10182.1 hypothetical protein [Moorena sp. SIO4E2]NER86940.1 hypothetical protein [Moorena sp. SIO3A2]NET67364.1 hypothetical protein [Moorena sp. SIO1G6]